MEVRQTYTFKLKTHLHLELQRRRWRGKVRFVHTDVLWVHQDKRNRDSKAK